jgi:hypothetical protein
MSEWRDHILRHFEPGAARLTVVADPDGLLLEEGILTAIRERGFDFIQFEDPVAFRYAYESQYRERWDRGEETDLVVVLRAPTSDLNDLPYDLLVAGRQISFSIAEIFPDLSYPVVAALDRGCFDHLYQTMGSYSGGELGDRATKEFLLKRLFQIDPDVIQSQIDLIKALLQCHYDGTKLPDILAEHLVDALKDHECLEDWPLSRIIKNRTEFFGFLQGEWEKYLRQLSEPTRAREMEPGYVTDVPFGEKPVQVYLDNLFAEGKLEPVDFDGTEDLPEWTRIGVRTDPDAETRRKLEKLIDRLNADLPAIDCAHEDWFQCAELWAETISTHAKRRADDHADFEKEIETVDERLNDRFREWLEGRYPSLPNLPYTNRPVMLHHVLHHIGYKKGTETLGKVALIVIDGMSFDLWRSIQDLVTVGQEDQRVEETPVFAWIPTFTAISRQALFSGEPPLYFSNSLHTTREEPKKWGNFWADQGYHKRDSAFLKITEAGPIVWSEQDVDLGSCQQLAVTLLQVDKLAHGTEMGHAELHQDAKLWARRSKISAAIEELLDGGFDVYLTSDHGMTEAKGIGTIREGCLAETRGSRARVFEDARLREHAQNQSDESWCWTGSGLPEDKYVLLAKQRQAFVPEGKTVMAHGGATLQEVVVPLIHIWRE